MNINVREYLRINPISAHELTLSDNDRDCFLFFPSSQDIRGYKVATQNQLFAALLKSIFGDLLDYSTEPPSIKRENVSPEIISQELFKNYIRQNEIQSFMSNIENDNFDVQLAKIESNLDRNILILRRKGILDYAGAVELQSNNTRKITWNNADFSGPIYKNMSYAEGQIWCKSNDSNISTTGGSDKVSIGSQPLRHNHQETMAEALTGPLAEKFGGNQLIGNFTIGSKDFIAYGTGFGPTISMKASPLDYTDQYNEILTYPLWGQNIINWRTPEKNHNNIPPSLNIYVRYWNQAQPSIRGIMEQTEVYEKMIERVAEIREATDEDNCTSEAQYNSAMVCELPEFRDENITEHDYILRISIDAKQQIILMRQSLQMLFDIFANKTNSKLSTDIGSMKDQLARHLDYLLVGTSEFMQWYDEKTKQLDRIQEKIAIMQQLIASVPPLNYIGRIIISYTDDTEQKVISHYGGKSWRRIENFLRGVGEGDLEYIPGQKNGEEYVELRESNIPIHAHTQTVSIAETIHHKWVAKNRSGDTKLINTQMTGSTSQPSVDVENVECNYQISPLEYPDKNKNEVTLPHDNLPPYMKMYIWECTGLTDEEYEITKEPIDNDCTITWLYNGGTIGTDTMGTQILQIGDYHSGIPTPSYEHHTFLGWKDMSGQIKTNAQILVTPISGNETYVAQWKKSQEFTVTFNGEGGIPDVMTKKYSYGEQIGYFPTFDEYPNMAIGVEGWKTEDGEWVNETDVVESDLILYAQWKEREAAGTVTIRFFDYSGQEIEELRRVGVIKGSRIGELDVPTREGYTFKGWFTASTGGDQVFATKQVYNNLNLYEQWIGDTCTITWNPNYDGCETFVWEREYNSTLGTLPIVNRLGYTQNGWWTDGGAEITSDTEVGGDVEYYAHWDIINYTISYNLNGGNWIFGQTFPEEYNVENSVILPTPSYTGREFIGWTGSNGNVPELQVSIPIGSIGNRQYRANWNMGTYTVIFNKVIDSAQGEMLPQTFTYDEYQKLNENTFVDAISITFNGNGGTSYDPSLTSLRQFLGWAVESGGAKVYNNEQNVVNLTLEDSINLYAVWGQYEKIYLPPAEKTGYALVGWFTDPQNGENKGTIGEEYWPVEETTLYAHWTPNNYYVTFDPQGGTLIGSSPKQVTYSQSYGELPSASYNDYTFIGWFTLAEEGTQISPETTVTLTQDHILYAHWEINRVTATFVHNDETGDTTTKTQDYGTVLIPPELTRSGYTFIGWEPPVPSTMPAVDSTYIAQWEEDVQIIRTLNPVELDMSSTGHTYSGYRGDDINTTPPMSAWAYGKAFINASNYKDAQYCAMGEVTTRFDDQTPLVGSRTITYHNGLSTTGSPSGSTTATRTAGLGGTCINTLTFNNSVKKLITSVVVCPYISCHIIGNEYWTYSGYRLLPELGWYWQNSSSGLCFYKWGSGSYSGVYSRGQYYNITMRLLKPDGTTHTIDKTIIDPNTKSTSNWTEYSASEHINHSIVFDFSQDILDAELPIGTYTTSLEFKQARTESELVDSTSSVMAIHGSKFYCNS